MARSKYRYSLDRQDAKLAGVCSTLGDKINVDPTFVRIGFLAAFFFVSWEVALVAYAATVKVGDGAFLPEEERALIRHVLERIGRESGTRPVGWLGSALAESWTVVSPSVSTTWSTSRARVGSRRPWSQA